MNVVDTNFDPAVISRANEEMNAFVQQYPIVSYKKDEYLHRAGDRPNSFFWLIEGSVKLITTSPKGEALILHIFHPGSCVSLLSLVTNNVKTYDSQVLVPVKAHKIPQEEMIAFLLTHAEVGFMMQLRLLRGLHGYIQRLEQFTFVPAYQQVAGLLIYFARHFGAQQEATPGMVMKIKITHQEISEWLGLSRENVSIQMKKLERDGFIRRTKGFLEIIDLAKLQSIAKPTLFPFSL